MDYLGGEVSMYPPTTSIHPIIFFKLSKFGSILQKHFQTLCFNLETINTIDENQSTKDSLQMSIGPITRARAKNLQEAFNGLVKDFIWANPTFKEEPKSTQAFKGIRANKEVQKSINVIMAIDGNN